MKLDPLEQRISNVLELFSFEEILDMNDITIPELLLRLVEDGTLELPEEEPL